MNTIPSTNVYFIHVYFWEATDSMQYRQPNAYHKVSNTNHSGSVSDSLGQKIENVTALHTVCRHAQHCVPATCITFVLKPNCRTQIVIKQLIYSIVVPECISFHTESYLPSTVYPLYNRSSGIVRILTKSGISL